MSSDVSEFLAKMGWYHYGLPRQLPEPLQQERINLISEEFKEYVVAVDDLHRVLHRSEGVGATALLAAQLDALVDLVYAVVGTARLQGFDFDEAWRRVHAANMAKEPGATTRALHDAVKPPGWRAPDHHDLVKHNEHEVTP